MVLVRGGGKRHRIIRWGPDDYEISWQYEIKYSGSRMLFHRRIARWTSRKGAERFARKWGCPMPGVTV